MYRRLGEGMTAELGGRTYTTVSEEAARAHPSKVRNTLPEAGSVHARAAGAVPPPAARTGNIRRKALPLPHHVERSRLQAQEYVGGEGIRVKVARVEQAGRWMFPKPRQSATWHYTPPLSGRQRQIGF